MNTAGTDLAQIPLLDRLEPFVVAPWWRFATLNLKPFGRQVDQSACIDVLGRRADRFMRRLVRLDRLTFGPEGMPMPEWLFIDGSALPGVITGLGMPTSAMPGQVFDRLGMEADRDELIPLAMYIAVPVRPPHVWYGHNLASLNRQCHELKLPGLATLTKAIGLSVMNCTTQIGATQWTSPALHVHARFGPLELLTAWTPAHANPATLTYRLRLNQDRLVAAATGGRRTADLANAHWIQPSDHGSIQSLETRIERGEAFAIVGPPDQLGRVPVDAITSDQGA